MKTAVERAAPRWRRGTSSRDRRATLAANLHAAGVIQGDQGQIDESLDSLQKALAIGEGLVRGSGESGLSVPPGVDALRPRRAVLEARQLGRGSAALERAEEILQELLRKKPGDSAINDRLARREYDLGELYTKLGLWDEAAAFFTRSFDRQPPAQGHLWRRPPPSCSFVVTALDTGGCAP